MDKHFTLAQTDQTLSPIKCHIDSGMSIEIDLRAIRQLDASPLAHRRAVISPYVAQRRMLLDVPPQIATAAEHQHPLEDLAPLLRGGQRAACEVRGQGSKAALQLLHLVPSRLVGWVTIKPLLPGLMLCGRRWLRLKLHVPTGSGLERLAVGADHYRLAMIREHSVRARIMCFFTVVSDTCS